MKLSSTSLLTPYNLIVLENLQAASHTSYTYSDDIFYKLDAMFKHRYRLNMLLIGIKNYIY